MTQPSPLLLLGLSGNVTTYLLLGLGATQTPAPTAFRTATLPGQVGTGAAVPGKVGSSVTVPGA